MLNLINKTINKLRENKPALFICNLGLGDQIDMIGAVRYLSQFHTEIHVACSKNTVDTLSEFYSDNPKIIVESIDEEPFKRIWIWKDLTFYNQYIPRNVDVYRSGGYKYEANTIKFDYEIPKCFYKDLGLDLSIEHSYFHIPENKKSKELYQKVKDIKYIFTQQKSSSHFTPLVTWDINERFTIDPNINLYSEDHHWYELANHFVNKPFPYYTDTIIHASELYIVNSSFRCLAAHLPLEATVKKCYNRETGEHIPEWTFNRHNPTSP
jgi:hypothetical protein